MKSIQKDAQDLRYAKLARAGATLGIIAIQSTLGLELARRAEPLGVRPLFGAIGIGGVGAVLMLCRCKRFAEESAAKAVLNFYRSPQYWGTMILVGACLVYCFVPEHELRPMPKREPAPPKKAEMKPPIAEPVFPKLQLSGIVLNGPRSSAIINRETVLVGETIANVRLLSVAQDSITVDYKGFTRQISMPRSP